MPVHPSLPIHDSWFSYSGSGAAILAAIEAARDRGRELGAG